MAEVQNFRTALNGFNRQDVVRYIEYLNNKHAAEIEQLNTQLAAAANAPDPKLQQQLEAEKAKNAELEKTVAQLRSTAVNSPIAAGMDSALRQQLEVEKARNEVLEKTVAELQSALAKKAPSGTPNAEELEAYRRAERVEREAQARAEQMQLEAEAILADATARINTSTAKVNAMMEQLDAQLKQCQEAVDAARATFAEAAPAETDSGEEA